MTKRNLFKKKQPHVYWIMISLSILLLLSAFALVYLHVQIRARFSELDQLHQKIEKTSTQYSQLMRRWQEQTNPKKIATQGKKMGFHPPDSKKVILINLDSQEA
jgi:cell division protein FtsL